MIELREFIVEKSMEENKCQILLNKLKYMKTMQYMHAFIECSR